MITTSLDPELLERLAREHGTPLYVYDLRVIAENLKAFQRFDTVRYAIKANSNLAVLSTLRRGGAECDAVSAGEVERALAAGFAPEQIVYTADLLDRPSRAAVARHRLHVNCGSASMIGDVAEIGVSDSITLRINPGFGDGHDEKVTTGGPLSKHGIWHENLGAVAEQVRSLGLKVTGLHVHIGSGTDTKFLNDTIGAMDAVVRRFQDTVEHVSCGGGMSIPYREGDAPFDLEALADAWLAARDRWSAAAGRRIVMEVEPGRRLVATAGTLLTEVCGEKSTGPPERGGQTFVLVDAGFHTLLRPLLYGAYHRISAVGKEGEPTSPKLVAGPLCESADVFTQGKGGVPDPRPLPELVKGDLLAVHDVGAYGAAMASCYNSRPLPAEVVIAQDGEPHLARPALDLTPLVEAEKGLLDAAL